MGYQYGMRYIDMGIYHIDMVILDIDMEYGLMIWEMTASRYGTSCHSAGASATTSSHQQPILLRGWLLRTCTR